MDVKADLNITNRDDGGINVELAGPGMGAIIGRRGETLDAIQHLANYVVNRGSESMSIFLLTRRTTAQSVRSP